MKRNFFLMLIVSFLSSFFSLVPTTHSQETPKTETKEKEYTLSNYEQEVFRLVNEERKKHNRKPLELSIKVSKLAREKSEDMRDKDYYAHNSPTYGKPCDHMKQEGVNYRYCGENIAADYKTPEEVMKAWMDSKAHRENILSENYTHIGIGYAEGGRYGTYWTQQFYS